VLGALGDSRNGSVLVGFAAEEGEEGLARKRRMLAEKQLDLVVFNDVSRDDIGFDAPDNEVVLIGTDGERKIGKAPKGRIAAAILDEVEKLLA
jgi:phosphopantothenoylcysteine decarboxylase/phosphopantothenate--cysteine ligase